MNKTTLLAVAFALLASADGQAQDGFDKTAIEIVNEMSPGWNLGNTLEAATSWTGADLWNNKGGLGAETGWQGTKTTQQIIDFVRDQGFRSVRIPCAWAYGHIADAATYTIDAQWMARVREIVDYCINDGLYVVLNEHWDGGWLENNIADNDLNHIGERKYILQKLWTQIATEFKDYDEHLLFAGLNEPNAEDQTATNNLAQYNQAFVDAVRATGGNNQRRVLVVQGPSTNIDHTCNYMKKKMPKDVVEGKLAIEVHYYAPWQFWGMGKDESWGNRFFYWGSGNHVAGSKYNATWGEESYMKEELQKMKTNFLDKGYPVVIGEFGANWRDLSSLSGENQAKHNASIQVHYRELFSLCKQMGGMVPMVWDTNYPKQDGTNGSMTIIDRSNLTIFGTYALAGINEVWPKPDLSTISEPATTESISSQRFYDLAGRQVESSALQPGIYISNNRKVLVK